MHFFSSPLPPALCDKKFNNFSTYNRTQCFSQCEQFSWQFQKTKLNAAIAIPFQFLSWFLSGESQMLFNTIRNARKKSEREWIETEKLWGGGGAEKHFVKTRNCYHVSEIIMTPLSTNGVKRCVSTSHFINNDNTRQFYHFICADTFS